jgi:HEPN domain-containing protein
MDKHEKFNCWLELARYNIESAESLFDCHQWLHVASTCQQALEQLLKGLYILHVNQNPPRVHELAELLEPIERNLKIEADKERCLFLHEISAYDIDALYPDYEKKLNTKLNEQEAHRLLEKSKETFSWLLTLNT